MDSEPITTCYCCTEQYTGYYQTSEQIQENLEMFLTFLDDDIVIQAMFDYDNCRVFADRFLIAAVFKYFMRMGIHPACYHKEHFFTALQIAHDIYEEANEKVRYELNMWTLGSNHKLYLKEFAASKWNFLVELNFKTKVCEQWCRELFARVPGHAIWNRVRGEGHGGVIRQIKQKINGEDRYVREPGTCYRCENPAASSNEQPPPPPPANREEE